MKKAPLLFMLLFAFAHSHAQVKESDLTGTWKYTGAMKSKAVYQTDPKWYKESKPTPKFETLELKAKGACTWNEKGKTAKKDIYVLKGKILTINGIDYEVRSVDKKNLLLYRGYYSYKDENGKLQRVDDEQITFQKVK